MITKADLAQFTGTESWFRHSMFRNVLYTDGIKFMAENAGAYWLIDLIAAHQSDAKIRVEQFQVWKLTISEHPDTSAVITCTDGDRGDGAVLLHRQEIEFTDFPLPEIEIWVEIEGQKAIMLLPSEH